MFVKDKKRWTVLRKSLSCVMIFSLATLRIHCVQRHLTWDSESLAAKAFHGNIAAQLPHLFLWFYFSSLSLLLRNNFYLTYTYSTLCDASYVYAWKANTTTAEEYTKLSARKLPVIFSQVLMVSCVHVYFLCCAYYTIASLYSSDVNQNPFNMYTHTCISGTSSKLSEKLNIKWRHSTSTPVHVIQQQERE